MSHLPKLYLYQDKALLIGNSSEGYFIASDDSSRDCKFVASSFIHQGVAVDAVLDTI